MGGLERKIIWSQKKKADQCILLINKYKFRIYNQLITSHYMDKKKAVKVKIESIGHFIVAIGIVFAYGKCQH
jgi:hypothetical protein